MKNRIKLKTKVVYINDLKKLKLYKINFREEMRYCFKKVISKLLFKNNKIKQLKKNL